MEHIFLVDLIGKLPEKPVCLKKLSSLTGWDFSTGLFRSIHIFLGFPSSSRPFTIYFRFFPIVREMEWVFDVNGNEPLTLSALSRSCQFLPLSDRTSMA